MNNTKTVPVPIEYLVNISDFMLDKLRKGNITQEDFRQMAKLRNDIITIMDEYNKKCETT